MWRLIKLILIMLCGSYPILELTRWIMVAGIPAYPEMKWQFIAEISVMWLLFSFIPAIFLIDMGKYDKKIQHSKK